MLGVVTLRRAEDAQPPVPVDEIERLIEERKAARTPARLRGRRRHPECTGGAGHPARGQPWRHALETKVKRPDRARAASRGFPIFAPSCPVRRRATSSRATARRVSTSYTRDYPLVIAQGSGAIVEDVDGNVFLDCTAGIAVASTGHSHPDVVDGDHRAGAEVPAHVGDRLLLRAAGAARRGACRRSRRCRARTDRSSATRAPRRTKRRSSWRSSTRRRHNVIAFFGAFHGRSMGSLSLTAEQGPAAAGVRPAACRASITRRIPTCIARACRPTRPPIECIDFIEQQLFVHLVSPDEVAAIVVEPIQGEGGYIVPPDSLPAAAARDRDAARHPADRRRSAVGHGTDGEDVRDRARAASRRTSSRWPKGLRRGCRSA